MGNIVFHGISSHVNIILVRGERPAKGQYGCGSINKRLPCSIVSLFDQAIINYRQLAIVNYIGGGARTCNQAVNYIVLTACQWNVQIDVRRRTLNVTDLSMIIGDRDVGGKSTEVDSVRKIERIPSITRFSSSAKSNRDLKYRKTAHRGFR